MARHVEHEVAYYYDSHPTEKDLMGEASIHAELVHYLVKVLRWLLREQVCAVYNNLNFYQTPNPREYPLEPDIAVIKGVHFRHVRSWRVGKTGPAPQVVFEIASEETWKKDLHEKPMQYALMGVEEYFAYDPNDPPAWRGSSQRLFGWQLEQGKRAMRAMPVDASGRLWSPSLDSFLVPEREYLRLYERNGQPHPTEAEAQKQRAEAAARRADSEARRADVAARRAEALAEKLRSLGIDPDQV
jgi:Uma2 family endonuclease